MKTGNNYYSNAQIQYAAKTGVETVKVDDALKQSVLDKVKGARDGRISQADALAIAKDIADGGRYGVGEKAILKALWAARDDRKSVTIDGQKIRLTDPAEAKFTHAMLSFWGSLGAKARADASTAEQALPQTTQHAVQQFAQQFAQVAQQAVGQVAQQAIGQVAQQAVGQTVQQSGLPNAQRLID